MFMFWEWEKYQMSEVVKWKVAVLEIDKKIKEVVKKLLYS